MSLQERRSLSDPWHGRARRLRWQPLGRGARPPAALRPWLTVPTSLTRKLEEQVGRVSVRILQQGVGVPLPDEAQSSARPCLIRDVLLQDSAGRNLVLAHSVLPGTPRGPLHPMLKRLGRQALGSLLFTRPGFVRWQREWARLDSRHPLYRAAQVQSEQAGQPLPAKLWARRACFSPLRNNRSSGNSGGRAQTVQVTEVFLLLA